MGAALRASPPPRTRAAAIAVSARRVDVAAAVAGFGVAAAAGAVKLAGPAPASAGNDGEEGFPATRKSANIRELIGVFKDILKDSTNFYHESLPRAVDEGWKLGGQRIVACDIHQV